MDLKLKLILIALIGLGLIACNRTECKNTNPIFDKFDPASLEYKNELVNQINLHSEQYIRYFFDSYLKIDSNEYIIVDIQGTALCAKMMILVEDWNVLENIQKVKGNSYKGAELIGLTYNIYQDPTKTEFTYKYLLTVFE